MEMSQITGVRSRELPTSLNTLAHDGRETTDCPSLTLEGQIWTRCGRPVWDNLQFVELCFALVTLWKPCPMFSSYLVGDLLEMWKDWNQNPARVSTTASTSDSLVGPDCCFKGPSMMALFSMKAVEEVEAEVVLLVGQT